MDILNSLSKSIVASIRSVVGGKPAALHEPSFSGNELAYLKECIDSTFVSSIGKFVDRFEVDLASYTGAKHVVAVVNGTAALHIALKLSGVQADDEVLVPTLTFVATANAVHYCGATPHFIDSEENTLGIDAEKLKDYLFSNTEQRSGLCINRKTGKVIRALIPMHTFGHPSNLDGLIEVAYDFNIALVEDAAESLGSFYYGRHTGTVGLMGTLSFNGNKTITTGGGGAIMTNSSELARQAKHLTTTAKLPHAWRYCHDQIGYNYRMPNLNAALGCAQLEQLPHFLEAKRILFQRYEAAFRGVKGVNLIKEPAGCKSNYWLQTLILDKDLASLRDSIIEATNNHGLMTRPSWDLISELTPYRDCPHMNLDCSTSLLTRLINIPSSPSLAL